MSEQKLQLQDVIKKISSEEDSVVDSQTQETIKESSDEFYDFSDVPVAIRESDWFRNAPLETRKLIAAGKMSADLDVNDITSALDREDEELLEEINKKREQEDKLPFTKEEYMSGKAKEILDQEIEEEQNSVSSKPLLDLESDNEDEDDDDETEYLTAKQKLAKEIEDMEKGISEMNKYVAKVEVEESSHNTSATKIMYKKNKEFESNVKSIFDANKIKFKTGKKGGLKKAVLNSFIHNNTHVTVPLVNSGIYVTLSGASIPEIIGMSEIRSSSMYEIKRRYYEILYTHLIDTSIGSKLTFQQFLSVVSHLDEPTLFYGLYTATFPNEQNEFLTECGHKKCGETVKVLFSPYDMVLNAEEFEDVNKYILYENTDIKDVLNQSVIAREKLIQLSNGAVISLLVPSLYDHLAKLKEAEDLDQTKLTEKYETVLSYISFIKYIALQDEDGHYIQYDSIKELAEILLHMDIDVLLSELGGAISDSIESKIVEYGINKYTCPKCNRENQKQVVDITQYLFLSSQLRKMEADLQQMKLRYSKIK